MSIIKQFSNCLCAHVALQYLLDLAFMKAIEKRNHEPFHSNQFPIKCSNRFTNICWILCEHFALKYQMKCSKRIMHEMVRSVEPKCQGCKMWIRWLCIYAARQLIALWIFQQSYWLLLVMVWLKDYPSSWQLFFILRHIISFSSLTFSLLSVVSFSYAIHTLLIQNNKKKTNSNRKHHLNRDSYGKFNSIYDGRTPFFIREQVMPFRLFEQI